MWRRGGVSAAAEGVLGLCAFGFSPGEFFVVATVVFAAVLVLADAWKV